MNALDESVKLLLVDDERDFREAVTPGLQRRGFEVHCAETGADALERLAAETFDVMVLDVKMPGMDGYAVFDEVQRRWPDLPVVILTGHGSIQQAFETSRQGVYEYLAKPCEVDTLADLAHQAARHGLALREQRRSSGARSLELLFVDDDEDLVRALVPALERRGLTVTVAHDSAQALALSSVRRFDVALVDVVMSGMHGLTLMSRLRDADPLMPVVVLTGHPSVADARRALQQGAYDYLVKPQPVEDLSSTLKRAWLRRQERERARATATVEETLAERPE